MMSDIESVDRAQYQLESTLGVKYYEVHGSNLKTKESVASGVNDATNEVLNDNYKSIEIEFHEPKQGVDIDLHHETEKIYVCVGDGKIKFEKEDFDVAEQHEEAVFQIPESVAIIKENLSDDDDGEVTIDNLSNVSEMVKEENGKVNTKSEVCENVKRNRKRRCSSVTPLSNKINSLSHRKELRLVLEDIGKQNIHKSYIANNDKTKKDKKTPIKNARVLEDGINNTDVITTAKDKYPEIERLEFGDPKDTSESLASDLDSVNSMKESTRNIQSIDKDKLEFTPNDSNMNIKKEIDDTNDHNYEGVKIVPDDDLIKEEIFITDFNVKYERYAIKKEYATEEDVVDENYEADESDNKDGVIFQNNNISTKIENVSDVNELFDDNYIVDEAVEQRQKRKHSEATLRCQSEELPDCKELGVVIDDVMLSEIKHTHNSDRQYTDNDQWTRNSTICHPRVKKKNLLDRNAETLIINDNIDEDNSNKKIYKCCHCDFKSHRKRSLRAHVNTEHTKNIPFECSLCTFTTYDKWILTRHVNAKHTKTTVYNCTYCDYKAYLKHSLSAHINTKHTKANVYNCSYCSFKTHLKHSLNLHVNVKHTKRNVFNCSYCSFTTYRKYSLSTHINNKHTKDVLFNCTQCSYKAYDKVNLKRHVNALHTKTTVFNCCFCSHQVYNKSALNKHVKAKHS